MLTELRVRDLAVIADVTLPLQSGLNVLTGETGAGKSMLVDALALLLGERASSDVVRSGASKTIIEGAFELAPTTLDRLQPPLTALGVDAEDGRLVLKREITAEGRSRAWVNGSPTTIGVLAQLGALLVDLHGQHETQSLLRAEVQRDLLDAFSDAELERGAARNAHERWKALEQRDRELREKQDDVRRKADYLRHVTAEIGAAGPKVGDDETLAAEAQRLAHADELGRLSRELDQALGTAGLARAGKLLGALQRLDPSVDAWQPLLDGAFANLDELGRAARAYAAGLDDDPGRLAVVEQRRDVLFRLTQKYGPTLPDVLATRDAAARELELLDTADLDLRALADQREVAAGDFARACGALTAQRTAGAARLSCAVNDLLPALGMPGGRFDARLVPFQPVLPDVPRATAAGRRPVRAADGLAGIVGTALVSLATPHATGAEGVVFEVQLNVGLDARPLARVASGGELSRLMLALKVVLAKHDAVPTLVFDEVDQGIGGEAGARVGEALAAVAHGGDRQALVITHLPQIAAYADHHLVVAKGARGGVATSDVQVVAAEVRRRELARMLGDPDMTTALQHAAELLRKASETPASRVGTPSRPASVRPRR